MLTLGSVRISCKLFAAPLARVRKSWWGSSEWLQFVRGFLDGFTAEEDADSVRIVDAFILNNAIFRMSC